MTDYYTAVTGATSGIGLAAAEALAARGHHLVLTARRRGRLEALRADLLRQNPRLDIRVRTADLAASGHTEALYDEFRSLPLRIWINNAGRGHCGDAAMQDTADLRRLLELDVTAVAVLSVLLPGTSVSAQEPSWSMSRPAAAA